MPSISFLIEKRKWEEVSEALEKLSIIEIKLLTFKCFYFCSDGYCTGSRSHNILHYVLSFNPPISIVRSITEIFPEAANKEDCMNRYPLHVALICGASADVIRHLIKVNEKAVSAVDAEGKTSLHHLFSDYIIKRKYNSDNFKETVQSFPEIIHTICQHDPKLILKEDMNNMSVLGYVTQEVDDYPFLDMLKRIHESASNGKDLSWFRQPPPYNKTIKIMKAVKRSVAGRSA